MENRTANRLKELLMILGVGTIALALAKYLFYLLFPVFLAYLFSEGIRRSLERIHPLAESVKRILAVLFLLIFFSLLSLVTVLLAERFLHYTAKAAQLIGDHLEDITLFCKAQMDRIEQALTPIFPNAFEEGLPLYLPTLFQDFLKKALETVPKLLGEMASFLPRFFLSLIIFLVSCYYFSCDWERIRIFAREHVEEKRLDTARLWKKHFFLSLKQYTGAYILLFLLSFTELFLGLVLLRCKNAFGTAFLIALIDLLPVLGCGTVLVPWSLLSFLLGDKTMGIGLLVLYLAILFVRQFAEPKILGTSIGLHPILSLLLVILGLKLLGIWGMILFPLLCTCYYRIRMEKES